MNHLFRALEFAEETVAAGEGSMGARAAAAQSPGLFRAPAFGRRQALLSWLAAPDLPTAIRAGLAAPATVPALPALLAAWRT
ncbi:hypothetical protein JYK14_24405, partial [Siccirubricoccus sp. KC 17139]